MFRKRERWVLFVAMALLPVTGPLVANLLEVLLPGHQFVHPLAFVPVLLLSGCVAYYSVIQPARKLEPVAKEFLDTLGEKIINLGRRHKIRPRLNILLFHRKVSWLLLRRYLSIVWGLEMENQPDVKASFPVSKGVAGEVFRTGRPRLVNMEQAKHEDWGFSKRQAARFQHLTAIYSWPIYQVDHHGNQTGKRVGTVNLDALETGACDIILRDKSKYDKLLGQFAEFASKILS